MMDSSNSGKSLLTRRTFGALSAGGAAACLAPSAMRTPARAQVKTPATAQVRTDVIRFPRQAPAPLIVEPSMPKDPALRAVAEDVLAKLKYSFAAGAAEDQPSASSDLDRVFRSYLASRFASTQRRYREQSQALLTAPARIRNREFRRYAGVDAKEYRTLGSDKLAARVGNLAVDGASVQQGLQTFSRIIFKVPTAGVITQAQLAATLKAAAEAEAAHMAAVAAAGKGAGEALALLAAQQQAAAAAAAAAAAQADLQAGLAYKKMRLFIRTVKCVEETDEVGADHINMGGNATDPYGNTSFVNQFVVSSDFDQNETVDFGFGKTFHTWNLATNPVGFPYVYAAVIALAEKDDGGFYRFLKDLWEAVGAAVIAAIGAAAGAAIGAAIGSTLIPVPVIGAIVGAVLGAFVVWVISWFDNPDDIIAVKPILMTLGAATKSYYDWAGLTSPQGFTTMTPDRGPIQFKGDGGRYDVHLAYRIFTQ